MSATEFGIGKLVDEINRARLNFLTLQGRLPFVQVVSEELARTNSDYLNERLLQLVHDSFDMLVIDLASFRDSLVKSGGLLNLLRPHVGLIRRYDAAAMRTGHVIWAGEVSDEHKPMIERACREADAAAMNEVFDRIFPSADVVTEDDIDQLIKRFRDLTEPTDSDRNRARAHRFEKMFNERFRQNVAQVAAQMNVFSNFFGDLLMVLTRIHFDQRPLGYADAVRSARDFVRLMTSRHGFYSSSTDG